FARSLPALEAGTCATPVIRRFPEGRHSAHGEGSAPAPVFRRPQPVLIPSGPFLQCVAVCPTASAGIGLAWKPGTRGDASAVPGHKDSTRHRSWIFRDAERKQARLIPDFDRFTKGPVENSQ